jgi:hypothetical protein
MQSLCVAVPSPFRHSLLLGARTLLYSHVHPQAQVSMENVYSCHYQAPLWRPLSLETALHGGLSAGE